MHANLGNALLEIPGRLPDAIHQFETAVRIRPDFAEAHYLLGLALLKSPGRRNDAVAHLEATLRLKPDPKLKAIVDRLRSGR
jgi:tetratricopeptide (TPR) repeat protein